MKITYSVLNAHDREIHREDSNLALKNLQTFLAKANNKWIYLGGKYVVSAALDAKQLELASSITVSDMLMGG